MDLAVEAFVDTTRSGTCTSTYVGQSGSRDLLAGLPHSKGCICPMNWNRIARHLDPVSGRDLRECTSYLLIDFTSKRYISVLSGRAVF
jgi:hypothetical protein